MKTFLLSALLCLYGAVATAQTNNVNAAKVTIKDSIWFGGSGGAGKWLRDITTNAGLPNAKDNEVPSTKAIKAYVDAKSTGAIAYAAATLGITGAGDKTTLLNAQAASTVYRSILFNVNETTTINGAYNGQGKVHRFENGSKIIGSGTVNNILIDAPAVQIFDTSVAVLTTINTDIYAVNYGFLPTASAAQNTRASQRISDLINSMSGGVVLHFERGAYAIGSEVAGPLSGQPYYREGTLLYLHDCTKPIQIELNGATFKFADGLHFGSFDPTTGKPANIVMNVNNVGGYTAANGITITVQPMRYNEPIGSVALFPNGVRFTLTSAAAIGSTSVTGNLSGTIADGAGSGFGLTNYQYAAYPNSIIDVRNNKSVIVRNGYFDGNVPNLVIGGGFDDDGIQLPADGILASDNENLVIENYTGYQMPRDGLQIGNTVTSFATKRKPVVLNNIVLDGNVRQGLSVVGSNQMSVNGLQAINTGKTVNVLLGRNLRSSPAAGIDLEQESGSIKNSTFNNIYVYNNDGPGVVTVSDVSELSITNSKIIGTTGWSLYGLGSTVSISNSIIVGSAVNLYGSKFTDCTFTMDSTLSPNGKVYGTYTADLGGSGNPVFTRCTFDGGGRANLNYGGATYYDCIFKRRYGYSFSVGFYNGINTEYLVAVPPNPALVNSTFTGPYNVVNPNTGVLLADIAQLSPDVLRNSIVSSRKIAQGIENTHNTGLKDTISLAVDQLYANYYASSSQAFSSPTVPSVVDISTTTAQSGISISNNEITVSVAGNYSIFYSAFAAATGSANLDVRLQKWNGTAWIDVGGTRIAFSMASGLSNGGNTVIVAAAAGDKFRFAGTATSSSLISLASGTSDYSFSTTIHKL